MLTISTSEFTIFEDINSLPLRPQDIADLGSKAFLPGGNERQDLEIGLLLVNYKNRMYNNKGDGGLYK